MQIDSEKQIPAPGEVHAMLYGIRTNVTDRIIAGWERIRELWEIVGLSAKSGMYRFNYPADICS